jgi:pseudaminic acid synthase
VLFVAEISANHNGSFSRAKQLVEDGARAGASAVKFQTYKPETMTLDSRDFSISNQHSLWGGLKLFDLYREAMTPWEWHAELFDLARSLNLIPFSSPFDHTAVDFLESLGCSIYKIASLEIGDLDLIKYTASTGKRLIMSTGAATLSEIQEAVDAALQAGCKDLTLLLCTSAYPAPLEDIHLKRMTTLSKSFGLPVGFSDHSLGITASLGAVALGAAVIERHLTISRTDGGYDSQFSLEPQEFRDLVDQATLMQSCLGVEEWNIQESEQESRRLRRSLFVIQNVKAGEEITRENVKNLRPSSGGPASHLEFILGKRFRRDFSKGMAIRQEDTF